MNVYRVDGVSYNNVYVARIEAHKRKARIIFDYYEDEFDKVDWKKEPEESMEVLMDRRATQLRLKYDKLIFFYSGGYDSHTIYNVLNRNKVRIDEFIFQYSNVVDYFSIEILELAKKHWWDHTAKFTTFHRESEEGLNLSYSDPDWIYKNEGICERFTNKVPGSQSYRYVSDEYSGTKYGIICGLEKPSLVFKNNQWFARKLDKYFSLYMGLQGFEAFFCSPDLPELDVKQSHLLRKAMVKLLGENIPDGFSTTEWPNVRGKDFEFKYHTHALGCGRHGEMITGISTRQKIDVTNTNVLFDNVYSIDAIITGQNLKNFHSRLAKKNQPAINFLKGIHDIKNNSAIKPILKDEGDIKSIYGLWNKSRAIT